MSWLISAVIVHTLICLKKDHIQTLKKCWYVTIEKRGEFEKENLIDLNNWIFGCDICQDVCPWNIKFSVNTTEENFYDKHSLRSKDYDYWENLSQEEYKRIFKNSAVKRTKYSGLTRNILTAKEQINNDDR